jgi:hypothetical protein
MKKHLLIYFIIFIFFIHNWQLTNFIRPKSYSPLDSEISRFNILENQNNITYIKEWNITWGGVDFEWTPGISFDVNQNVYIAGFTGSFGEGGSDSYILKVDPMSELVWNLTWGGIKDERTFGMVVDGEFIYLAIMTDSFGSGFFDCCLVKYNLSGYQLWNRTWGGDKNDFGYDVDVDSENNVYVSGYTNSYGNGSFDIFIVKYDPNGEQIWNRTWGGSGLDGTYGIIIGLDDSIYVPGWTESFSLGEKDAFIVKYNSSGHQIWNRTWGGDYTDIGWAADIDTDGNCYMVGPQNSFGAGGMDAFLVKYDAFGERIWNLTWGGIDDDYGYSVALDEYNNPVIMGTTKSYGIGNMDVFVAKYNSSGHQLWNQTWGGIDDDEGCDLNIDCHNNIYLSGRTSSYGSGDFDAYIMKYGTDHDNDGITYDLELKKYQTNPYNPDTDSDGLTDGIEIKIYGTNPNDKDTDHDRYSDLIEINAKTNPLDPYDHPIYYEVMLLDYSIFTMIFFLFLILSIFFKKTRKSSKKR